MPDITNPQAVRYANEVLRPLADQLTRTYYLAQHALGEWFAQGLNNEFPNDAQSPVVDGAAADGRPVITGFDVWNLVNRAQELVTDYEANGNAKLNTVVKAQVNGAPRS